MDRGSLTARLQHHSGHHFRVQILAQRWGRASTDEARILRLSPRARVLIREVILLGRDQPWVWARSILPAASLTGSLRRLVHLDDRPLGGWLFRQPSLSRGPMQIACIDANTPLLPTQVRRDSSYFIDSAPVKSASCDLSLWGRRSVFYVKTKPLLVSEVFLPDFLATLSPSRSSHAGPSNQN